MLHEHHRKRRSQGGDDSPVNVIRIPDSVHNWIHENPAKAYDAGLLVKSHDDPSEVMVTIPEELVKRPRAKKAPEAPRSRTVISIKVPKDEKENGADILNTLLDECRESVKNVLGFDDDVPVYYVLVAVLHDWLTDNSDSSLEVEEIPHR